MSLPVDVRDLVDRPGAAREVHMSEPVAGLATELASVPEDVPVRADLLLESVVEGILVSGPLSGEVNLRCSRCLKDFRRPFEVRVTELFAPDPGAEDEHYPLAEGAIDIEPLVRDAVVLEMPFSPLCRPDCQGLCEICGGDRNLGECPGHELTDPRWDALKDIDL
ncbi:MAG TPA: YceD family protein [Actinomycetota bacterium]|nr:YceD family protein [Actinomycetota bacterium]